MASATHIPLETYLHTSYRPDRDYIDGEVLERSMGEIPHSRLQAFFTRLFARNEAEWGLEALPEVRVQVAAGRFRVPDVTAVPIHTLDELIVQSPPALCIEIFSSEDRMSRMQERVADYQAMGVPAVWVLDPWRRVAYLGGPHGKLLLEEAQLTVPGSSVAVTVEEVFAELDRLAQR